MDSRISIFICHMILLSIFKFSHTPLASIRRNSSRNTIWILLINTFVYRNILWKKISNIFKFSNTFILILLPRINPSKVPHEYINITHSNIDAQRRDRSQKIVVLFWGKLPRSSDKRRVDWSMEGGRRKRSVVCSVCVV